MVRTFQMRLEPTRVRWDDDSQIKCALKTVSRETDVQVCTDSTGRNREVVGCIADTHPRPTLPSGWPPC